jgi:hypothetical protein
MQEEFLDEAHVLVNKIWRGAFPRGYLEPLGQQAIIARAELARIRAEARAEALKEAAERAWDWLCSLAPQAVFGKEELVAAILADEPKEER